MTRKAVLVLVAIGVLALPVALVALSGGDDDGVEVVAGRTVVPEGIDADNAPKDQLEDPREQERPAREEAKAKGGGGPKGPPREYPASGNVAYPNDVTQSGGELARILERHIGATGGKGDHLTVIGADCRKGACSARYVSGPHGGGKILRDAAVILRRAFARRSVRSVKLYVHEPRGKRAQKVEPMALAVITCRRADHPSYAWSKLTHRQLPERCAIVEQSPGRLGAQIRKGKLSEEAASRGEGGARGGTGGSSAPPGAKPYGSPAPENVKPKPRRDDDGGDADDDGGSRGDRPDAP
jgi:hypothetical protein